MRQTSSGLLVVENTHACQAGLCGASTSFDQSGEQHRQITVASMNSRLGKKGAPAVTARTLWIRQRRISTAVATQLVRHCCCCLVDPCSQDTVAVPAVVHHCCVCSTPDGSGDVATQARRNMLADLAQQPGRYRSASPSPHRVHGKTTGCATAPHMRIMQMCGFPWTDDDPAAPQHCENEARHM